MAAFLTDEMMPPQIASLLCENFHDAIDIHEAGLRGEPDADVFAFAHQHNRILITADLGFSNELQYPPGSHSGIVIVRYPSEIRREQLVENVVRNILSIPETDFTGAIIVLSQKRIRRRGP